MVVNPLALARVRYNGECLFINCWFRSYFGRIYSYFSTKKSTFLDNHLLIYSLFKGDRPLALSRGNIIMRYAVIIEKGTNSYGAYVPDLPGCVAVGETIEEVKMLIQEAIEFHL
jgi:hypothetical protein